MNNLWKIYSNDIPEFIEEFANVKEMKRLDDVGMNCGCQYTSFQKFNDIKFYSRWVHSISVALIIWHFTNDIKQSVAGLFHDIATPAFSHTIDFLNGDHENQESTEDGTRKIIESSNEIMKLLDKYGITVDEVCDYHIYPIADNNSPKLSADRLEYSLGNMLNYGFCNIDDIEKFYNDLVISKNEFDEDEICFKNEEIAVEFSENIIKNSLLYVSDEDRFSMQKLADIVKFAIDNNIISLGDLHETEEFVINKLKANESTKDLWENYSGLKSIKNSNIKLGKEWIKVKGKKRYIDCYIVNKGRISNISDDIRKKIDKIKKLDFDYWINATVEEK